MFLWCAGRPQGGVRFKSGCTERSDCPAQRLCVLAVNGIARFDGANNIERLVMTDTNQKPDMRNPEMSDARKAAEKKIGEASFTPDEKAVDAASQSATAQGPAPGHTTKP